MSSARAVTARHPKSDPPNGRPRAELSRDGILSAALDLIDAKGLATLNMRELGRALGASTMSVYRHFQNKSDLLDAVVDSVVEGFAPPQIEGPWQAQARAMSLRVRATMLAHPELADLIGRELRRSTASLRVNAEIIGRLRAAGAPAEFLAETYWALSSYTTGYALLEAQARRHRRGPHLGRSAPERVRKLASMLEAVEDLSASAARDAANVLAKPLDDAQFSFGLECLIQGLERKFAAAQPRSAQTEA